jgi:hypothetical protein
MNQIYGTYMRHLFLFNVQQMSDYEWVVFHDKTG